MKVPIDGLQNKLTGYLRRRKVTDLPGVTAVARIDRRTKRLTSACGPERSRLSITLTLTG